jgi:hypothetical protein
MSKPIGGYQEFERHEWSISPMEEFHLWTVGSYITYGAKWASV